MKYEIAETNEETSVARIGDQFKLIRMFGLPETMTETHYVRVRYEKPNESDIRNDRVMKDGKHAGLAPHYTLCKRANPIVVFDNGDGCSASVVRGMQKTYAERIGGMELKTNNKAVIENILCSGLEAGDVEAFAEI